MCGPERARPGRSNVKKVKSPGKYRGTNRSGVAAPGDGRAPIRYTLLQRVCSAARKRKDTDMNRFNKQTKRVAALLALDLCALTLAFGLTGCTTPKVRTEHDV